MLLAKLVYLPCHSVDLVWLEWTGSSYERKLFGPHTQILHIPIGVTAQPKRSQMQHFSNSPIFHLHPNQNDGKKNRTFLDRFRHSRMNNGLLHSHDSGQFAISSVFLLDFEAHTHSYSRPHSAHTYFVAEIRRFATATHCKICYIRHRV